MELTVSESNPPPHFRVPRQLSSALLFSSKLGSWKCFAAFLLLEVKKRIVATAPKTILAGTFWVLWLSIEMLATLF